MAASRSDLWNQHRGNFKSTPPKNPANLPHISSLQNETHELTGQ
jgi:hypothetical protein